MSEASPPSPGPRWERSALDTIDDEQADRARGRRGAGIEAFTKAPPVQTVAESKVGELARDLEPLMRQAEAFLDDQSHPVAARQAVEARLRTLRSELHLHGGILHDAVLITQAVAHLMTVLASDLVADLAAGNDPEAGVHEAQALAAAAVALCDDETAAAGAAAMTEVLDALARDASHPDERHPAMAAAGEDRDPWLEHDFYEWRLHRIVTGAMALSAIGAGEVASAGKLTALARAGWALVRARFRWRFPA
jgi:hypothetical protein